MIFNNRRAGILAVAAATAIGASACGITGSGSSANNESEADGEQLQVVTAFYPLHYATERIAGDHAEVTDLTKPGAEPHDLELGPRDVGTVVEADLSIYLKDFQPSVDDAVAEGENGFDVGQVVDLKAPSNLEGDGHDHEGETEGNDDHADDEGHDHRGDHEGHDHGNDTSDPHFWLDPTRYADAAREIANQLGNADPDNARHYDEAAAELISDLQDLDQEFAQGLAECQHDDLVVSHEAFGYLTDRYDLTQHGISGLNPDSEPSPRKIAELVDLVNENDVSTIYHETLVSEATAETIANEADVEVAVLDPVEGLTDSSEGENYLEVMRSNLETLQQGQDCKQ